MAICFYNTLTREKEKFEPLQEGTVRMYTCGPTVYDYAHIGNFRAYLFEDILRRHLEFKGYTVIQVMNLTDVDYKTINGAHKNGLKLADYTSRYKAAFFEDINSLKIKHAEYYPCATDHIKEMIQLISILLEKGYAYKSEDGSIYFSISKFPSYGKLAHLNLSELKAGARVKHDEYQKDNLADFALWKAWDEKDGDIFWEAPFGKGRPGWHIECSAMSMKYLGETFDIHTGGIDNSRVPARNASPCSP
jgi:cysteinyl-tRNA synthetase